MFANIAFFLQSHFSMSISLHISAPHYWGQQYFGQIFFGTAVNSFYSAKK